MSKGCSKIPYQDKKSARSALLECWSRQRSNAERAERSIYWCKECQAFHLTSLAPDDSYLGRSRFV